MHARTKSICFMLLLAASLLYLSSCSSGSDAAATQGTDTVVTVTNYSGTRLRNAAVVLGDSSGNLVDSGTTDENGQITFTNSPLNCTVTAAFSCVKTGATVTSYSMDVQYDVNGSVVMSLDGCETPQVEVGGPTPVNSPPVGTITINLTSIPGNVVYDQLMIGQRYITSISALITSQTFTVEQGDLNSDGTLSILVLGRDTHGDYVGYGLLQNQTYTNGMTMNIAMSAMSYLQFSITNLPSSTIAIRSEVYNNNSGGLGFIDTGKTYSLSSAPSSTTIAVPYIPGPASSAEYVLSLDLDRDHDGIPDGNVTLYRYAAPADQNFDLGSALSVPVVTVTGGDTARPTISWSGADPASLSLNVWTCFNSSSRIMCLSLGNFMRSRTSLTFPELPDSLAAFRPTKVEYASISTYSYGADEYSSSDGYIMEQ